MVTKLERLNIPELQEVYTLADHLRAEELNAANNYSKAALRRMRKTALALSKNCVIIRKKAMTMYRGGITNVDG
jgi:hypothetical protein